MNNLLISGTEPEINQNQQRRYRVLMVAGFLRGYEGITSHIATLARGLQQQSWEVALGCGLEQDNSQNSRGVEWLESQGIKYYPIPFPSFRSALRNGFSALTGYSQLKQTVEQFQPDLIHVHSLSVSPYLQILRLTQQIPVVFTCHMDPKVKSNNLETKLGAFMNRYVNPHFLGDRAIAISNEVKESYVNILNIAAKNICLIYHGIDSQHFRPSSAQERLQARESLGLAPDARVVCLIGRLSSFKGHNILVEALSILKSHELKAIALCAGTGDWEQNIREYAAELGVTELVHMLGFTDSRQVLWASDVIVLPSRREGFGLVIPEAMLCGVVPVRTPAAGVFDQIDDGVNGCIVPFDAPEALAWKLKQLLENDELRSQMSRAALESARQKFTVDRMIKDTIAVYEELINESSHLRKY